MLDSLSIFISHASRDEALTGQLQSLLQKSFGFTGPDRFVFRSSEEGAVAGGADWYAEIIRILKGAKVCLTLLTPNSLHQPWLLYESGAAYALQPTSDSRKLICVLAGGIEPYDLPAPYQRLQHRSLTNTASVKALLGDIASLIGRSAGYPREEINAIVGSAASHGRRWGTVKPGLVVEAADGSPFNIEHLLEIADERIIAIGQNLHWLSQATKCQERIIRFLSEKPGRRFDIVICNVENDRAVAAWAAVNPSIEADEYTYRHHLRGATSRFLALKEHCLRAGVGTLTIHVRDLIPFGATVVDPAGPEGLIVLQPVVNYGPKAAERPQFPISKATNDRVFSYYWRCLDTLLGFGRTL